MIRRRLWERPDFRALSYDARALYCYLRTCPMGSLIGVFRLHVDDVVEHLGLPADRVEPALRELEAEFIRREGRYVWVIDAFATTPGASLAIPNHRISVQRALLQIPQSLAAQWWATYGPRTDPHPMPDGIPDPMPDGMAYGTPEHIDDGLVHHGDVDVDGTENGHEHKGLPSRKGRR